MEGGALRRRAIHCERNVRARGARPSICIVALLLWLVCASASNSGAASLTITRAEGAPAQYPAAVTTDYVREFNIHIETNSPGETSTNEPGCTTPAISATVDLQFAESAADAVNDPAAKCGCI